MKTHLSDFEGSFKAYKVNTGNGNAYQPDHYGRDVDIGGASTITLSTQKAQAIYGDSHALTLINPDRWPGKITLHEAPVRLVTLSMTFNEVVQMGAALAARHGGKKLCDITPDGSDKITRLFAEQAQAHGLMPLGQYFVTSRAMLESFVPGGKDLPDLEEGMEDLCMETPNETVGFFKKAETILPDLHCMLLFNEGDFPGYASKNRYYVSGLFAGAFKPAKLPVEKQTGEAFPRVMAELHRTLG